ncbi:hypothetical protein E3T35_01070 [Cryobacterium sp. TMT1-2-2]|nr:hypothetical protein E3T35_01070 [Cryobacterium sp. TMT1-2-2]
MCPNYSSTSPADPVSSPNFPTSRLSRRAPVCRPRPNPERRVQPSIFRRRQRNHLLNFVSHQFSGFHAIVVPGTLRDSLYILDGLLEQQTTLQPTELMTDTAGYSDHVYGLFRLLGYQFNPRLADIGSVRFWRTDRTANYGPSNGPARNQINTDLITTHWDDLLRVAGSLAAGAVQASGLLRVLQGGGRPTPLGRAWREYQLTRPALSASTTII